MTIPTADAGTQQIAQGIRAALGELEEMNNDITKLRETFQAQGWGGMDELDAVPGKVKGVSDTLQDVANKIGIGGQIVADAHLNNNMITNATKTSLTGN